MLWKREEMSDKQRFEEYLKNNDSKIGLDLVKPKQIFFVVGLLTSVGVVFSFNSAAIAPVYLSLGIFYVFTNLGYLLYLVKDSKCDRIWVIICTFVAIIVSIFQFIIAYMRGFS